MALHDASGAHAVAGDQRHLDDGGGCSCGSAIRWAMSSLGVPETGPGEVRRSHAAASGTDSHG